MTFSLLTEAAAHYSAAQHGYRPAYRGGRGRALGLWWVLTGLGGGA